MVYFAGDFYRPDNFFRWSLREAYTRAVGTMTWRGEVSARFVTRCFRGAMLSGEGEERRIGSTGRKMGRCKVQVRSAADVEDDADGGFDLSGLAIEQVGAVARGADGIQGSGLQHCGSAEDAGALDAA